jgi:hypothetical protein
VILSLFFQIEDWVCPCSVGNISRCQIGYEMTTLPIWSGPTRCSLFFDARQPETSAGARAARATRRTIWLESAYSSGDRCAIQWELELVHTTQSSPWWWPWRMWTWLCRLHRGQAKKLSHGKFDLKCCTVKMEAGSGPSAMRSCSAATASNVREIWISRHWVRWDSTRLDWEETYRCVGSGVCGIWIWCLVSGAF